jgi:hypothetical protein
MYTTILVLAAFYLANALLTGALCEAALRAWKDAYRTKEDPALLDWLPMYHSVNRFGPDRLPKVSDRIRYWSLALIPFVQTIVLLLMVIGTSLSLLRQRLIELRFGSQDRMERWLDRSL